LANGLGDKAGVTTKSSLERNSPRETEGKQKGDKLGRQGGQELNSLRETEGNRREIERK
jgi:hypothetical protein